MPLSALQLLNPACPVKPAWAVFDPIWYLHRYEDARLACIDQAPELSLIHYLRVGAALGHSPSPLFDERYYLAQHVDVASLVRDGKYASGFDHFCRYGHRALSPHWLFDDQLYGNLYEDMSLENLDLHHCYGRYDHYLKSGQRERRMAQFLFDGGFYRQRAIEAGVPAEEIDAHGPYVHCLYRLNTLAPELACSIYFEPAWYLAHNEGAKAEIVAGRYSAALQHYLCGDDPGNLDPVPEFSEAFYLHANPDVARAVESGLFRSGYQHFIQQGAFELRRPCPDVDLLYYRDVNTRVRNDLNLGEVRDAFAHLRLIGLKEGLVHRPPEVMPLVTEPASKQAFLQKARNLTVFFARHRLDFSYSGTPVVSVIMVLFNKFDLTMLALSSLRDNFPGAMQLILVDNDSSDETRRIGDFITGAIISRSARNIGFPRACNLALEHVAAPALLYLNNDVELGHGAIAAALNRLNGADKIGAVGAKIIRSHGLLQEAGSIIWNEGTTTGYMRDSSPLAPEANFVRDVDYCSAVFLLVRADLVKHLGGFDEDFSPAYYEEVDLCVRLAASGYRVVYDPSVVVHHLEFGSAAHSEVSMALMRRGRRIFSLKHADYLKTRLQPASGNLVHARAAGAKRRRVLFIEDTVPVRRLGSGFVRANDCVNAIAQAGYEVTVFPVNGAPHDMMSLYGDLPEDVEVMHDRNILALGSFLAERPDYYELIWISRTHNLQRCLPVLTQAGIDPRLVPLVLDTEAVVAERDAARAALEGRVDFDAGKALASEFESAAHCRHITAISAAEADLLTGLGLKRVSVLGTIRAPAPTPASFAERRGLLFVASIHEQDSPNFDSLLWYAGQIFAALAAEMGEPPVLNFAGYAAPEIDLSPFAGHPYIRLHGPVGDLQPFYNAARVFIAPTRYAAGTPYKIYEAASFGLPCVATDLLAGQLGWGEELLTAPAHDARAFAAQVARLYRSEPVWNDVRAKALKRLAAENTKAAFNKAVGGILRGALQKTSKRMIG